MNNIINKGDFQIYANSGGYVRFYNSSDIQANREIQAITADVRAKLGDWGHIEAGNIFYAIMVTTGYTVYIIYMNNRDGYGESIGGPGFISIFLFEPQGFKLKMNPKKLLDGIIGDFKTKHLDDLKRVRNKPEIINNFEKFKAFLELDSGSILDFPKNSNGKSAKIIYKDVQEVSSLFERPEYPELSSFKEVFLIKDDLNDRLMSSRDLKESFQSIPAIELDFTKQYFKLRINLKGYKNKNEPPDIKVNQQSFIQSSIFSSEDTIDISFEDKDYQTICNTGFSPYKHENVSDELIVKKETPKLIEVEVSLVRKKYKLEIKLIDKYKKYPVSEAVIYLNNEQAGSIIEVENNPENILTIRSKGYKECSHKISKSDLMSSEPLLIELENYEITVQCFDKTTHEEIKGFSTQLNGTTPVLSPILNLKPGTTNNLKIIKEKYSDYNTKIIPEELNSNVLRIDLTAKNGENGTTTPNPVSDKRDNPQRKQVEKEGSPVQKSVEDPEKQERKDKLKRQIISIASTVVVTTLLFYLGSKFDFAKGRFDFNSSHTAETPAVTSSDSSTPDITDTGSATPPVSTSERDSLVTNEEEEAKQREEQEKLEDIIKFAKDDNSLQKEPVIINEYMSSLGNINNSGLKYTPFTSKQEIRKRLTSISKFSVGYTMNNKPENASNKRQSLKNFVSYFFINLSYEQKCKAQRLILDWENKIPNTSDTLSPEDKWRYRYSLTTGLLRCK